MLYSPVVISTWDFGKAANEDAMKVLLQGRSALDAVEEGIWVAEADPSNSTVGFEGTPNEEGVVQVDAAIMWGPGKKAGSVACMENILHPISVARRVMEESRHVMLVGEGALKFALSKGFEKWNLTTEETRRKWQEWKKEQEVKSQGHDTIGMVARDQNGDLAVGCSTSGAGYKEPGRVGDSPLIGSGLYVDNDVGGASATGLGEDIMRYCSSFMVVENMRNGMHPEQACKALLRRILEEDPENNKNMWIALVALNKQGEYGAAAMCKGFPFAVFADEVNVVKEGGYVVE